MTSDDTYACALVALLQAQMQGSEPSEELLAPLGLPSRQGYTQQLRMLQLQVSLATVAACTWHTARHAVMLCQYLLQGV